MANSTIKFPQEMPPAATINGDDKIMIADAATNEAKSATWDAARQYLSITGIELKPVPAGPLPAGPSGEVRKMQITEAGTWTFAGSATSPFVNPNSSIMDLWWDGSTWTIAGQYALPTAQGVDVLNPQGQQIPKEEAVAVYVNNTSVSYEKIGFAGAVVGDNIAPYLFNTDLSDTSKWGVGMLREDGSVTVDGTWYHTKEYIPVVPGTYVCNVYVGGAAYFLTYDENLNVVNAYNTISNAAQTTNRTITISANEKFIRTSKNANYEANQNFIRTNQDFPKDLTDQVYAFKSSLNGYIGKTDDGSVIKLASKGQPYLFNPNRAGFDYRAIKDIKLVNSDITKLKDSDGNWLELYLVYMRFIGKDVGNTTIVQIAKKNPVTGVVGVNNISVSTYNGPSTIDSDNEFQATLTQVANSGLNFQILIDWSKLRQGVDTGIDLAGTIRLDTKYFAQQLGVPSSADGKYDMYIGDSTVEFGTIPTQVGNILGRTIHNAGVGGTRFAPHTSTYYNALSFYKIAEAINTNDFTAINTAMDWLIADAVSAGDNAKANRLRTTKVNMNRDWSNVDNIYIQFGTNDFSSNTPLGDIDLTNKDFTNTMGSINYGVEKIMQKYPSVKLLFISPTHRFMDNALTIDSDTFTNTQGIKLIDEVDAIKEMVNKNHLPIKDMYRDGFFNKYNHTTWFSDGVHPNNNGFTFFAKQVAAFIKTKLSL